MSKELKCGSTDPRAIRKAKELPQRLQEVHEGRIVFADDAVNLNNDKPIAVVCTVCGHKWNPRARSILVNGHGCPECKRIKASKSAGNRRCRRASEAEKELSRRMRGAGLTYRAIAHLLGRDKSLIQCWCCPEAREKQRKRASANNAINKASGHQAKLERAYRQTAHGKAVRQKKDQKRRSLKYHAHDTILVDGIWHEVDMYDYITTAKDRELWSFAGADTDVALRKEQQIKLEAISGEVYSLEHLIPLSRGGIHHPYNFANRALALNVQKGNRLLAADTKLFCKRLFNIQ